MAKGKIQQSIPARELAALIKEVEAAKLEEREPRQAWDVDGLLSLVKKGYELDRFQMPPDKPDMILSASGLLILKVLVDFIDEKMERDTLRGIVPIRGMVLLWESYFGAIPGGKDHPGLKTIAEYLLSKKPLVELSNGEKVTPLAGFITKELMPFLDLRLDSAQEGFADTKKKYSTMIQESFEGVHPIGQEYSLYIAQDALARIVAASHPTLFSEQAQRSIPSIRKPLEKAIDRKTVPKKSAPSAAAVPAAPVKDEISTDETEKYESRQDELTTAKITSQVVNRSSEDYLRKFLESCSNKLPSAYSRKFPIDIFMERTLLWEEPSGKAENISVAELPVKMKGKSGVIVGEAGIGITSIIKKMIQNRNASRNDGEHVLICLSAEDLRPSSHTQHHLEDVVLNAIKQHLPGNPVKALALQEYIGRLDKLGLVTFIIDDSDKSDVDTLGALAIDLNKRDSVFFSARAWQTDGILRSMKNELACKITVPEWFTAESDELIHKLIALLPDGSLDRRSFELRLREFPELKNHPLGILACFEQTIKNDNVAPVVIHQWITELAHRSGLPVPDLLTTGRISENDDYYLSIGRAIIAMINRNRTSGKAVEDVDLPRLELTDQVMREISRETKEKDRLDIRDKVKRLFLAPGSSGSGYRVPNLCFSIFLGGLARDHRAIELSADYNALCNQESTNLARIRMMEESIWELRMKDYAERFRPTTPPSAGYSD
jgi:hypothetical protein